MPSDEMLVQKVLSGNKDAFGKLVKKYSSAVYGLAYHLVGSFVDAQDIAQKVFITAYLKLRQLKDQTKFRSWLRTITINTCRMWLRKQKGKMVSLQEIGESNVVGERFSPEEGLIAKEEKDMVRKAIASLSEKCRLAITLYYLDGLSYEDIADFLGITRSAVDSRLHRARKKLKEEVLRMTKREFNEHRLPEDFSDKVVAELLAKPKPLEIPEHPLRKVWERAKASLPNYRVVEGGSEIESVQDTYDLMGELLKGVFHVDRERMLRFMTTTTLLNQLSKHKPPIKLLTAGRAFRRDKEDATHYPVFHQIEGLCVDKGVAEKHLKETVKKLIHGILGNVELRFRPHRFPFTDPGWDVCIKVDGKWLEILGTGMFQDRILREVEIDVATLSGFGFGMTIERVAMIKYGIKDIRTFWRK